MSERAVVMSCCLLLLVFGLLLGTVVHVCGQRMKEREDADASLVILKKKTSVQRCVLEYSHFNFLLNDIIGK